MSKVSWKSVWNRALKSNKLFPLNAVDKDTISVSCPTRFSGTGKFAIEITPSFNDDDSISLKMLVFNDNVSIEDFSIKNNGKKYKDFNTLSGKLVEFELSNRLSTTFDIESKGFKDDNEALNALVDYINSKATESGRMFDDKLDELNDVLAGTTTKIDTNSASTHDMIVSSIRESRRFIFKKIESILNKNYKWKTSKNEEFTDSTASFYTNSGQLAAVVSLVDNFIIVDLAKDITAKISTLQSDEEIEKELKTDIADADKVLADREVEQLKDVVNSTASDISDKYDASLVDGFAIEKLERRVSKLENLYIERKLRRMI